MGDNLITRSGYIAWPCSNYQFLLKLSFKLYCFILLYSYLFLHGSFYLDKS